MWISLKISYKRYAVDKMTPVPKCFPKFSILLEILVCCLDTKIGDSIDTMPTINNAAITMYLALGP